MPTPTNTYSWTGAVSDVLSATTNWNPTVTNRDDSLFVLASGGVVNSTTNVSYGSLQVSSSFYNDVVVTGSCIFRAGNFSQDAYGIYIADGKTYTASGSTAQIQFGAHAASGRTQVAIYCGVNASFRTVTYYGTGSIRAYGPGKVYLAYGATSGQTQPNPNGVIIDSGTIAVRGTDYATNTTPNPWGTGTLAFVSGSSRLNIESGGGSRSFSNPVSFPSGATFQIDSGSTIAFINVTSAGGTLTIAGTGTTTFTQALTIPSIAFTANGTLNLGSGSVVNSSITGSTGTLNAGGSTIIANCPSFTGSITGNFNFAGGIHTLGAVIQNTVTPTGGGLTFTAVSPGTLSDTIGYVYVFVMGRFNGSGGTINLAGTTPGETLAFLGIDAASNANAGINSARTLNMLNTARVGLYSGATISNPITANTDTSRVTIVTSDASSCSMTSNFSTNQSSGLVVVEAAQNGTLTLSGSFTSSNSGRTFALNEDVTHATPENMRPTVNIGGVIKVTGAGFSGCPSTLKRGTLYLNSASAVGVGTTLTVTGSNTTVACSSTGAYAAQINGNVSFDSGTVFRFGAPA